MSWFVDPIQVLHISILVRVTCVIYNRAAIIEGLENPAGSGTAVKTRHALQLRFVAVVFQSVVIQ